MVKYSVSLVMVVRGKCEEFCVFSRLNWQEVA